MENPALAVAIFQIRRELELNQSEFSKKIGLKFEELAELEMGERPVTLWVCHQIEKKFGVDPYVWAWCRRDSQEWIVQASQLIFWMTCRLRITKEL